MSVIDNLIVFGPLLFLVFVMIVANVIKEI